MQVEAPTRVLGKIEIPLAPNTIKVHEHGQFVRFRERPAYTLLKGAPRPADELRTRITEHVSAQLELVTPRPINHDRLVSTIVNIAAAASTQSQEVLEEVAGVSTNKDQILGLKEVRGATDSLLKGGDLRLGVPERVVQVELIDKLAALNGSGPTTEEGTRILIAAGIATRDAVELFTAKPLQEPPWLKRAKELDNLRRVPKATDTPSLPLDEVTRYGYEERLNDVDSRATDSRVQYGWGKLLET